MHLNDACHFNIESVDRACTLLQPTALLGLHPKHTLCGTGAAIRTQSPTEQLYYMVTAFLQWCRRSNAACSMPQARRSRKTWRTSCQIRDSHSQRPSERRILLIQQLIPQTPVTNTRRVKALSTTKAGHGAQGGCSRDGSAQKKKTKKKTENPANHPANTHYHVS